MSPCRTVKAPALNNRGEDVNCWICLGVPQSGEEDQVKIIGTLCRKIIHKEFIHQLQQGDTDQVLALLNQTLSS